MSDKDKSDSIFKKVLELGQASIDAQIHKARQSMVMNQDSDDEDDFEYGKAVTEDPSYQIHSQGWKEKPHRIQNSHLKQMSYQDSVIASVIQTRQGQVSNFAKPVRSEKDRGFIIKLKNEDEELEEIKRKLKNGESLEEEVQSTPNEEEVEDTEEINQTEQESRTEEDDELELSDWELNRRAKRILEERYSEARRNVEKFVLYCGKTEDRPFDTRKWNLKDALVAWTRDSLVYDLHAHENIPDRQGKIHHWIPVDGSTIRYSSNALKKYKDLDEINFTNMDLLYPEKQEITEKKQEKIELDQDLLDQGAYRWVQVVRGKIERAYTDDELKVGIRNLTTDIYNNGYGVSELELLIGLVTGHLNAEYYNQHFFTQGFAAKGVLHIKKNLNRRKLETLRQQWQHMVKGTKNAFQTPIFAGMEDVEWIPLGQNPQDIGFEGWMRYLVRMICSIYRIDPQEIGIGFKDEGASGGISGDNTEEKLNQSRDKGLYPMMTHFQRYINENIIDLYDDRFCLEFTGLNSETPKETIDRQQKESTFKKTLNEIRSEDNLPPIPGGDDLVLSPVYLQWYSQFSDKAQELMQQNMMQAGSGGNIDQDGEENPEENMYDQDVMDLLDDQENQEDDSDSQLDKSLNKSKKLKVEYYKLDG